MKKALSLILALVMALGVCTAAFAGGDGGTNVTVTISDKGSLVVVNEIISVTDADKDGSLTINDALICAHDKFYDGGAAKGYEYTVTTGDYAGISMIKLWGDTNKGSLGYYLNDAMAWSLADAVKDGDYVYAFSYKDADGYSDSYAFFDKKEADAETYSEIELTLNKVVFENWNPVSVPAEGAMILIDGKETGVVTDKDGKATVTVTSFGDCVISAKSTAEGTILTPPACSVNAKLNIGNIISYYFNYIVNLIKGLFAN